MEISIAIFESSHVCLSMSPVGLLTMRAGADFTCKRLITGRNTSIATAETQPLSILMLIMAPLNGIGGFFFARL